MTTFDPPQTVDDSQSTTQVGDSFRDAVCQLLRTQYPDAKTEQYVGGTKVDILFSTFSFGKREVIAVECKNYEKALSKSDLEREIYPKYNPLLEKGLINDLIVVSRKPIGSQASDYIKTMRSTSHQTLEELEESLLGIRQYVEGLAALRPTDDAEYIEGRFAGQDGAALARVEEWVASDSQNGLAILGSYGQGKSSLARRIAAHYAQAYLHDQTGRIPIRKTLGDVVHETRLEALFGAEFTADFPLKGYQFKTFDHLNQSGRLLVILDGFDEMKHAMTASDFLTNFREFNRLLRGKSKVLLLGRPNAMPSGAQQLVFRGLKMVANQVVASLEYAPWVEWTLDFFSPEESRELLESALASAASTYERQGRVTYEADFLAKRTEEVLAHVPTELLKRPVHVQLIAGLAADPGFDLKGFNEYRLYEHFIQSMVERDTLQKRARKGISLEDRLQFQRDLAWWAWRRQGKAQGTFFRDEIPESVLAALPWGNAADFEGKRNEYIVSTLTEEKDSGVLYFAHRSFQEFLVADRLRTAKSTPGVHAEYALHLTPDVISFLVQAPDPDFIFDWYDTLIASSGPLPASYLSFYLAFPKLIKEVTQRAMDKPLTANVWTVALVTLASRAGTENAVGKRALAEFLYAVVRSGDSKPAAVAVLALMQQLTSPTSQPEWLLMVSAMIERSLRKARVQSDAMALSIESKQFDFAAKWLGHIAEKVFPSAGKQDAWKIQFEASKLAALCTAEINGELPQGPGVFGDGMAFHSAESVSIDALKAFAGVADVVLKPHEKFLRQKRNSFNVVSHSEKRSPQSWNRDKDV